MPSWEEIFANFILGLFNTFLLPIEGLVRLFPDMPVETIELMPADMSIYLYWIGNIINMEALLFIVTMIVTFEVGLVTVRIFIWLYKLLPFT